MIGMTVQPPVRVPVRRSRYAPTDNAKIRGRIVGTAFDDTGNLWAYAIVDENEPVRSPYGIMEGEYWPVLDDEFICVTQGWNLEPAMGIIRILPGIPIFVYAQVVPEVVDALEGD